VPESQTGSGKDSLRHIGTIVSEHSHRQDFLVFITPLVKDAFCLLLVFAVAVFLSIYLLSLLRSLVCENALRQLSLCVLESLFHSQFGSQARIIDFSSA